MIKFRVARWRAKSDHRTFAGGLGYLSSIRRVRRRSTGAVTAVVLPFAALAAMYLGAAIVAAENPHTVYGSWSCSYDETAAFNASIATTTISGTCAEQHFTSGWTWNSQIAQYVPFGPEDWVDGPGRVYFVVISTTRMYGYGQIRDFQYLNGYDSPTIEAYAS